jgi:hypothetical protein
MPMRSGGGGTTADLDRHDQVANLRYPPARCSMLILIEAASSAHPLGMLALDKQPKETENRLFRRACQDLSGISSKKVSRLEY